MDLLSDWLKQIIISNKIVQQERVKMEPCLAIPTPVVDLIFLTCAHFDQPDEVRYLSVELFDRFIRSYFLDLLTIVWGEEKNHRLAAEQWKIVESKLNGQTSLRMLSCIQLASKFVLHPKILKPTNIRKHLKKEGKVYTLTMIKASEIRVWKTLNLQVNVPTVYTDVQLLLEHLKLSPDLDHLPSDVDERAVLLTDAIYLNHQEIFCKLFYFSTGRWDLIPKEKEALLQTECNLLYKAAAVAALSITFTSTDFEEIVIEKIAHLTNFAPDDIKALVNIINKVLLS